jgi:15-cis-phytoene synthase
MITYNKTAFQISRLIIQNYSTSFSIATSLFEKETGEAIDSIYGFVRFADEIVDTFHDYDKKYLLEKLECDYYDAVKQGISLNPVLQSFQKTTAKYKIANEHIQAFLTSMKNDLVKNYYDNKNDSAHYIFGSAEVVGLMCLKVFCNGDERLYNELEIPAMKLGSAFQKVNFLRDLKRDMEELNRTYFPEVYQNSFNDETKWKVVTDIENDFNMALEGLKKLPGRSKLAVLVAWLYYKDLLKKIKRIPATQIIQSRIRISNVRKICLLLKAMVLYKFRFI